MRVSSPTVREGLHSAGVSQALPNGRATDTGAVGHVRATAAGGPSPPQMSNLKPAPEEPNVYSNKRRNNAAPEMLTYGTPVLVLSFWGAKWKLPRMSQKTPENPFRGRKYSQVKVVIGGYRFEHLNRLIRFRFVLTGWSVVLGCLSRRCWFLSFAFMMMLGCACQSRCIG